MPEDRVAELFSHIAQVEVGVPEIHRVLARSRQRRRRAGLGWSASALVIIVAAGFAITQVAGSITGPMASSGTGAHGLHAGPLPVTGPAPSGIPSARQPGGTKSPDLPPPGSGHLLLGASGSKLVMIRLGSAARPIAVPGLRAVLGGPSQIVTSPAGGWVVTYTTDPQAAYGHQPARLALVTATGHSEPFGPVFRRRLVAAMAVSPDGSRIALSLYPPSGGATAITVLPMPGHPGATRAWYISPKQASQAVGLSWSPDGRFLSYIAGLQTGAGLAGDPETLDTAAPGSIAPGISTWPGAASGSPCVPDATSWLGSSGLFGALEECRTTATTRSGEFFRTANARTGASTGPTIAVSPMVGCGSPGLDPAPDGSIVLISYCGLYLEAGGRLTKVPGQFQAAALAG